MNGFNLSIIILYNEKNYGKKFRKCDEVFQVNVSHDYLSPEAVPIFLIKFPSLYASVS
jgi:hypothetical protein